MSLMYSLLILIMIHSKITSVKNAVLNVINSHKVESTIYSVDENTLSV